MGVNLRYRYNEDYVTTVTYMEDGEKKTKIVPQTIQVLGEANDSGIKMIWKRLRIFLNIKLEK